MTESLVLRPLVATNPLGLLAGLGVLDILTRLQPARRPTLRWTPGLAHCAEVTGVDGIALVDLLDEDRVGWSASPTLSWGPTGRALADVKVSAEEFRDWAQAVLSTLEDPREGPPRGRRADADLFSALVAEGAVAGKGDAKPTHLHFTAGQQRFLAMARELQQAVDRGALREAVEGPWRYESELPSFSWSAGGERIYAQRGFNPASEKRRGVPGADWLALLGLRFFPVAALRGQLETTGCDRQWKASALTWPIWTVRLTAETVRSVLADPTLVRRPVRELRAMGIDEVMRAPIRRSDQGGYGSFGAAEPARGFHVTTSRPDPPGAPSRPDRPGRFAVRSARDATEAAGGHLGVLGRAPDP